MKSGTPQTSKTVRVFKLKSFTDSRGRLFPLEFSDLPFVPQRCYIIDDVPSHTLRGGHAHKKGEQALCVLKGKVKVDIKYKTGAKSTYYLSDNQEVVYIPSMVWSEEVYEDDSVLLVISSLPYDREDYIETLEEFYDE